MAITKQIVQKWFNGLLVQWEEYVLAKYYILSSLTLSCQPFKLRKKHPYYIYPCVIVYHVTPTIGNKHGYLTI